VAAVVRAVKPRIIFTHSLQDYMEDHMNTARLAVTGAFIRAAPNYVSDPPVAPWSDTVIYHALPHGLRGPLREGVRAELYVDIGTTLARKGEVLAEHRSQQDWLDATQGMASMVIEMERLGASVGAMSRRFAHAEGFRRHLHFGFAPERPIRSVMRSTTRFGSIRNLMTRYSPNSSATGRSYFDPMRKSDRRSRSVP
jgi:LmbE family N-acetylglucosaminyl deacetylase